GLLLGAALATSLKTTLLLFTVVVAGAVTYAFCFPRRSAAQVVRSAGPALFGVIIVPAAIAAYFYARGGWSSLVYCVVEFNRMVVATRSPLALWLPRIAYVPLLIILLRIAWRLRGNRTTSAARFRFFFAVACGFFFITLCSFWI